MAAIGDSGARVLSAGVDSLYWSHRADVGPWFDDLAAARAKASQQGEAFSWRTIEGFALDVLPHGAFRFSVVIDCNEFRLHLTDSRRLPTIWVQVRAAFIHEVGIERAVSESVAVAAEIAQGAIETPKASRIDLYADLAGWSLVHDDRVGLVTHAKLGSHFRAGTGEVETVQVGKSPLLVRIYRKDIEVRERGGFAPVFWSDHKGPVTRVEVQVGSARLRDFRLSTVPEVLASTGDVWRYATADFLELRVSGPGARESWPVRAEWQQVQSLVIDTFPCSGVVPFRVIEGDRLRVLRALFGYLSSLGAIDGERSLHRLLQTLPGELAPVARGRSFAREVERKRRRLPRAVREAVIDSRAASAGPGKEAPWAPDPSQRNTETDA